MSRLISTCSLVAALFLSASASADRAIEPTTRFAQPPAGASLRAAPDIARMPARFLDRGLVRARLAAARSANLLRFRAYQAKGVFPSNTYADGKLNVWLDEYGHLCAAATIIKASGQGALVDRVAAQDNFIKLGDVTQGPLLDWILTSGFTQDELAAIQEPFQPVLDEPSGQEPIIAGVDPRLRRIEDQRLRTTYRRVDAMLVRSANRSLDRATDRLMANPSLAWSLIDG